ncbi:MAG: C10 family peptidase, partial [Bacteroidaceae bacterium]|nr:C10 family peptidase [Bacteroidaceae bacterium]
MSVYANQIDEARAITIAYEFMSGNGGSMQRAPLSISNSLTLSHTVSNADGNLLYVFNRGDSNGYVIVAGDDAVSNQVLGYSDDGSFDFDNIPPAMRGWMNGYACEIAQYRAMAAADAIVPYRTTFDKDVAPLTQARWGQETPYNQYCPSYAGKYSATGCVATAMAQIMYHHQWPVTGVGSKEVAGTSGIEVIDFAHTTYQWSRMTPVYSSLSTPEECDAVATLMYHVGRSVNMMYGDVSGAVSADAASAWATYWNYDKAVIHRDRRYYTID